MATYNRTYCVRHGKGYKYKRAVPLDVRGLFGGRKVWVRPLREAGRRAAENEARELAVKDQRVIDRLRALSDDERAQVTLAGGLEALERATRAVEFGPILFQSILPTDDAPLEIDLPSILQNCLQSVDETEQIVAAAERGRRTLNKVKQSATLDVLLDTWRRVAKPKAVHSVDAKARCLKRFKAVVGDMHPRRVTADHAAAFRDDLERAANLGPRTKRKYLEELHALFSVAMSQRLVDTNPFYKIKLAKMGGRFVDEESKKPFETRQVRMMFDALSGEHLDFQWVTRLFAYHGGRSGEFAQLRKEDVTVSFGMPVIKVHDEHGSLKNRQSVRTIPLHPKCMDFIAYADAAKGPWIFASFPLWKEGRRGAPYQSRASDFIRNVVKISDPDLTMHSLRHTWITLAREMNMPEQVDYAITGHARGRGHHARYGQGPSLKKQLRWLKRIDPLA